jgi:hypothetical protein
VADRSEAGHWRQSDLPEVGALGFRRPGTKDWRDIRRPSQTRSLGKPAWCCRSNHSSPGYLRPACNTGIAKYRFGLTRKWPSKAQLTQSMPIIMRGSSSAPLISVTLYPTSRGDRSAQSDHARVTGSGPPCSRRALAGNVTRPPFLPDCEKIQTRERSAMRIRHNLVFVPGKRFWNS